MSKKIVLVSNEPNTPSPPPPPGRSPSPFEGMHILKNGSKLVLTTTVVESRYQLKGAFPIHSSTNHQVIVTLKNYLAPDRYRFGRFSIDEEKWIDLSSIEFYESHHPDLDQWGLALCYHSGYIYRVKKRWYLEDPYLEKRTYPELQLVKSVWAYPIVPIVPMIKNHIPTGDWRDFYRYDFDLNQIAYLQFLARGHLTNLRYITSMENDTYIIVGGEITDGSGACFHRCDYNTGNWIECIGTFIYPAGYRYSWYNFSLNNSRILFQLINPSSNHFKIALLDQSDAQLIKYLFECYSNSEITLYSYPYSHWFEFASFDLFDDLIYICKKYYSSGFDAGWDIYDNDGNYIKTVKIMDEYGYLINL